MDDVTPKRVLTARSIPIHWQEQAEKEIHRLVNNGILAKVEMPTEWISPSFFVAKPNGQIRLVTDFTKLNKHVQRPVHPFPSPQEIVSSIDPSSKVFAKLDCVSGYHQIPLDEESSYLTTMLLPSGRYRYLRAPMGLNASSDEFCRRTDWALQGLNGVLKLVDDIIVFAPSIEILKTRLNAVIERCQTNNIILSKKKFEIGKQVTFAGFIISDGGIRPDPKKTDAIRNFRRPVNVADIRSFLGLCNQLGMFEPDLCASEKNGPGILLITSKQYQESTNGSKYSIYKNGSWLIASVLYTKIL